MIPRDTRDSGIIGTTRGLAAAACSVHEAGFPGSQGYSGIIGTTWGLAAAVCRVDGPGGLFFKSNNPNMSGGEKPA